VPTSFLLGLAVFVIGVDTYIVAAVLPAIADDLHEPIANVGLVASAYGLPVALLSPVFGPLSDRRGRRYALMLGLMIFTVAAAACAVAPTLPVLLAARVINGIGSAILMPAAFAAAGDLPDENARGRAIALLSATFPLSNVLGLPVGAIATSVAGWRAPFALIAIVAVVAIVGVATSRHVSSARTADRGYAATFGRVLRDRRALAVMSVTLVWFAGAIGLFIYMGEFFHEAYGLPNGQAGLTYVVVGVVGVMAARSSGTVIERFGARRTVLLGLTLFGSAALVLPQVTGALPLALAVFSVWAFGTWFGVPAMQTIVAGMSSTARGTMLAFNGSALNLGGVIGPIISGQIIAAAGFGLAGAWSAFLAAVAISIAWFVLPRRAPSVANIEEPFAVA
jgi:MFS transporter, DHA1 family, inner membrane transport protein